MTTLSLGGGLNVNSSRLRNIIHSLPCKIRAPMGQSIVYQNFNWAEIKFQSCAGTNSAITCVMVLSAKVKRN